MIRPPRVRVLPLDPGGGDQGVPGGGRASRLGVWVWGAHLRNRGAQSGVRVQVRMLMLSDFLFLVGVTWEAGGGGKNGIQLKHFVDVSAKRNNQKVFLRISVDLQYVAVPAGSVSLLYPRWSNPTRRHNIVRWSCCRVLYPNNIVQYRTPCAIS